MSLRWLCLAIRPLPGAIQGMVTEYITWATTSWIGAIVAEHRLAKTIAKGNHKLVWLEEKAETGVRHHVEPVSTV